MGGTTEIAQEIERRLASDPAVQELLQALWPRDPRYRYWQTPDGAMFIYTTEKMGDGKYASAIYQPTGKGSRKGKRFVTSWRITREVHHATRKAAKARALTLYRKAKATSTDGGSE
jgi:hypothetical protein